MIIPTEVVHIAHKLNLIDEEQAFSSSRGESRNQGNVELVKKIQIKLEKIKNLTQRVQRTGEIGAYKILVRLFELNGENIDSSSIINELKYDENTVDQVKHLIKKIRILLFFGKESSLEQAQKNNPDKIPESKFTQAEIKFIINKINDFYDDERIKDDVTKLDLIALIFKIQKKLNDLEIKKYETKEWKNTPTNEILDILYKVSEFIKMWTQYSEKFYRYKESQRELYWNQIKLIIQNRLNNLLNANHNIDNFKDENQIIQLFSFNFKTIDDALTFIVKYMGLNIQLNPRTATSYCNLKMLTYIRETLLFLTVGNIGSEDKSYSPPETCSSLRMDIRNHVKEIFKNMRYRDRFNYLQNLFEFNPSVDHERFQKSELIQIIIIFEVLGRTRGFIFPILEIEKLHRQELINYIFLLSYSILKSPNNELGQEVETKKANMGVWDLPRLEDGDYKIEWENLEFWVNIESEDEFKTIIIDNNCIILKIDTENQISELASLFWDEVNEEGVLPVRNPKICTGFREKGNTEFFMKLIDEINKKFNVKYCWLDDTSKRDNDFEPSWKRFLVLTRGYTLYNKYNFLYHKGEDEPTDFDFEKDLQRTNYFLVQNHQFLQEKINGMTRRQFLINCSKNPNPACKEIYNNDMKQLRTTTFFVKYYKEDYELEINDGLSLFKYKDSYPMDSESDSETEEEEENY